MRFFRTKTTKKTRMTSKITVFDRKTSKRQDYGTIYMPELRSPGSVYVHGLNPTQKCVNFIKETRKARVQGQLIVQPRTQDGAGNLP